MSHWCVFSNQLKKSSSSAGMIVLSSCICRSSHRCRGRVSPRVQICCSCSFHTRTYFSLFIGTKTVTPSQAWPVKRIYWIGYHLKKKPTQGKRDSLPASGLFCFYLKCAVMSSKMLHTQQRVGMLIRAE